jgi:hypothetical protein
MDDVADLKTRVGVLETKVTFMEGDLYRMLKTQQQMADDLHEIKETIATGRGAWLAIAGMAALAGGAGAIVHKLFSWS